jgi:hypothetical protein
MADTPIFTAEGSYGELTCDVVTGDVISLTYGEYGVTIDRNEMARRSNEEGYFDIIRLDVEEWRKAYTGRDITAGNDILTFGFWTDKGVYITADVDWRRQCVEEA